MIYLTLISTITKILHFSTFLATSHQHCHFQSLQPHCLCSHWSHSLLTFTIIAWSLLLSSLPPSSLPSSQLALLPNSNSTRIIEKCCLQSQTAALQHPHTASLDAVAIMQIHHPNLPPPPQLHMQGLFESIDDTPLSPIPFNHWLQPSISLSLSPQQLHLYYCKILLLPAQLLHPTLFIVLYVWGSVMGLVFLPVYFS